MSFTEGLKLNLNASKEVNVTFFKFLKTFNCSHLICFFSPLEREVEHQQELKQDMKFPLV